MITVNIHVYGIVQGVGFRPFVAVTANRFGIKGTVANKGSYVEIIAQGERAAIDGFSDEVRYRPPDRAVVLGLDEKPCGEGEFGEFEDFKIIESEKEYGDIFVSPDIATCDKCRAELFDKNDRRYLHPFINCTQCGPRLTILDTMPYDRERTSMGEFPMCEKCEAEYVSDKTRRYDAQPVCCNDCGPEVYIVGGELRGGEAITAVRKTIMSGKIAAIKGIGGFHLCCDAKNDQAVNRLRDLKRRPMKPFAVMMRDMDTARRECVIKNGQEEYLTGWQKPIMLLQKGEKMSLSQAVAPDNLTVGVMLPYAPVQMLLFDYPDDVQMTDCLVMTSGNARGAPICRSDEDALKEIGGFCDIILSHNRKILIRADDSVCDWLFDKPYMIRRSRGFAPLPIMFKSGKNKQALAIGGELKNSFCIARNGMLYPSPYVGDMADIRTVAALKESAERMCGLLEAEPQVIACDTHPLYNTVEVAQEMAEKMGLLLIKVQHHFAHILSCMAENNCGEEDKVIGVSFDGTGYGDDGTIWGGELMICGYSGYKRVGSIKPFMQVGGDLSAKEGWRIAVQLIRDGFGERAEDICIKLGLCDEKTFKLQSVMADKGLNSVKSTSCGRIFDGVSAILGIRKASTFEGEASTALMYEAENYAAISGCECDRLDSEVEINSEGFVTLNTTALAKEIAERYLSGEASDKLAYEFHKALAMGILKACVKIRELYGENTAALSGGVFQNRLLTKLTKELLEKNGFTVLVHCLIPPNDGGIALGQAAYAAVNFNK